MELAISTPAILFSTVSLMMIAFTNRYLAIASLIRELHDKFRISPDENYVEQIKHLHRRVHIIRNIQFIIVTSLLLSAVSMLFIYLQYQSVAQVLFFVALLLQIGALSLSIWEISLSIHALKIELSDMEEQLGKQFGFFGRTSKELKKRP
ncbi:DUF2721 domain-containing protein [Runella aurantiaca]|uniref:DUF2721 domain-containing protein n=1 Tax=Runella aurantiaca TaxID=2282308 RepID=A0A369I0C0_9BACT|nr:DUF2721 domain-containing protein [Runella aurantiaca]RDB02462.1 DUF2721 domain-containing protein [Runella aurantiaca]